MTLIVRINHMYKMFNLVKLSFIHAESIITKYAEFTERLQK